MPQTFCWSVNTLGEHPRRSDPSRRLGIGSRYPPRPPLRINSEKYADRARAVAVPWARECLSRGSPR
jgi:hypothetical protein